MVVHTPTPPPSSPAKKELDLVFALDCTGSMGRYISAAKEGIEGIAAALGQTEGYDLRFGLVAYRDHPPQDSTYVTRAFGFTDSLEVMHSQLGELSAAGGGDGPEAVAAALQASYEAEWRPDAVKVVVIVADAPPHGLGEAGDGFPNGDPDGVDPLLVLDAMAAKGITVYAVGCEPVLSQYKFGTEFFIACAEKTGGQAVSLTNAKDLAPVIVGASVAQMDEMVLQVRVEALCAELTLANLSEDEALDCVYRSLAGATTRKLGGERLTSEYAACVSSAPSLAEAKVALQANKGSCVPAYSVPAHPGRMRSLVWTADDPGPAAPGYRSLGAFSGGGGKEEEEALPRFRGLGACVGAEEPPPQRPCYGSSAASSAADAPQAGVLVVEKAVSKEDLARMLSRIQAKQRTAEA